MSGWLARELWRWFWPLAVGCCLTAWPLAGWTPAPLVVVLLVVVPLGWYVWGELTLPRTPLADLELARWLELEAAVAGVALRRISVVAAEPGEVDVPETLPRGGEIVLLGGALASQPTSYHLAVAARQLATARTPGRWSPATLLLAGLALGLVTGLHGRWADRPVAGLLAVLALAVILGALAAVGLAREEARQQTIEARAREILGAFRTTHPEAFADLAQRQGLSPEA